MTDADLDELERLARLASAGPWAHHVTADSSCVLTGGGLVVCEVAQAFSDNFEDGEFIAAANPAAVLALVAEVKRLREAVAELRAENDRLKRGDFTPDEFQALCHHLDGTGHCTRAAFEAGCRAYQDKLFGPPPASPAE